MNAFEQAAQLEDEEIATAEIWWMRKALEFYAESRRYEYPGLAMLKEDRGRRARQALGEQL